MTGHLLHFLEDTFGYRMGKSSGYGSTPIDVHALTASTSTSKKELVHETKHFDLRGDSDITDNVWVREHQQV
jgi:hypothetical protein